MPDYSYRLLSYLDHALKAKSRYYIHSPFVYTLLNALMEPVPEEVMQRLVLFRKQQRNDKEVISIEPVGTSKEKSVASFSVSELAARYSLSLKYGTLLFKLIRHFKPDTILETGTGTGFSAACMALANPDGAVHTIDALEPLVNVASRHLDNHELSNVRFHPGSVDDVLETVCNSIAPVDAAFLDANHTYDATLRYFETLLPYLTTRPFVIVDDIHWSKGMNNAWKDLCHHPRVTLSLDFYRLGVLFLNPDLSRQTFRLYY